MITNEEYLTSLHAQLGQVAKAILAGEQSFIEGAAKLVSLGHQAELSDDPDIRILVGVASETDHFPLAAVRQHWSPAALDRLAPELQKAEEWARQVAGPVCESLARRFAP